jgi:hypothetical protein
MFPYKILSPSWKLRRLPNYPGAETKKGLREPGSLVQAFS